MYTPPEKRAQFLFDHFSKPGHEYDLGYLNIMFKAFKELADLRGLRRLSQNDVAKISGISQASIARIESGCSNPTLFQLIRLTHALEAKIKFEPMTEAEIKIWKGADMESYLE